MRKINQRVLTQKQEKAISRFLETGNMTDAYKFAFDCSRMKNSTINKTAYDFFNKPKIAAIVEKKRLERNKKLNIKADYVLKRLIEIDNLDIADIVYDDGSVKPISDWPVEWRKSIHGIDLNAVKNGDIETIVKKIKIPDKLRNLELIGKHIDVKAWQEEEKKDEEESPQSLKIEYNIRETEHPVSITIGKKKHGS